MKKKFITFVKSSKALLFIYRAFGNIALALLTLFLKVDDKKILFISFGGQKYDDSPRALYEKMAKDPLFANYKFVWTFREPSKFRNVSCKVVKTDTIPFYIAALTSKVWITNSSVERGLSFKRSQQIEINTWHGTPLKKMGADINTKGYRSPPKNIGRTIYCSQSEYDREIFTRLFNTSKDNILISDLPRNDALLTYNEEDVHKIRQALDIPADKKVILYAPTYREYDRSSKLGCYLRLPVDFAKWQARLGDNYIVLFRAHYEVASIMGFEPSAFVRDVSAYPSLNELMVISDILISDYSSIYFDYSILERPMLNFSYDYDTYCQFRGLYFDLSEELGCKISRTEDELLEELQTFNMNEYCDRSKAFRLKYAPNAGHACDIVISALKELLT